MGKDAKFDKDMERHLKELGCLVEQEAVPDRLRELAARLREALLARQAAGRLPDQ
ncbi:hypothetical protein GIY56_15040 [Paracoccus sp. YIM 132242]|uniref:Anti-sigma factor NepR domain-containing protein n=1 Tax=Paracoccus lichenicola TaxID=2665644 RepID=A0A6L6HTJ1_9RHOB|nr:hypothetical protein [Paracoccus lichenicola]MTE01602.1 hypothetical protein [Paracoccus lichenicola]